MRSAQGTPPAFIAELVGHNFPTYTKVYLNSCIVVISAVILASGNSAWIFAIDGSLICTKKKKKKTVHGFSTSSEVLEGGAVKNQSYVGPAFLF
jgi:hypothetical protein